MAAFVAAIALIGDLIQHGATARVWIFGASYLVLLAAGFTWSNWSTENRDERAIRAERRPLRVHATRAKLR